MKRKAIAYRLRAIANRIDPPTIEQLAEHYDTHDTSYELSKANTHVVRATLPHDRATEQSYRDTINYFVSDTGAERIAKAVQRNLALKDRNRRVI
jgi:hypothetical protein